jgi:hypothetical protein
MDRDEYGGDFSAMCGGIYVYDNKELLKLGLQKFDIHEARQALVELVWRLENEGDTTDG